MKFLKQEKGSITVFVVLSLVFFLVVVVSVGIYSQNKAIAVEQEYQKIKSSYEQDVGNEDEIYNKVTTE